ncbi:MAG: hypothetical protein KIIPBIDF_02133 [Candidatus Methanoperedenaceae archaeon GB50]|nr:MAG: hypothetical protein KIIPBIDF_02133 [Candidatus Methanoperedenaceae archaeon GB50]
MKDPVKMTKQKNTTISLLQIQVVIMRFALIGSLIVYWVIFKLF